MFEKHKLINLPKQPYVLYTAKIYSKKHIYVDVRNFLSHNDIFIQLVYDKYFSKTKNPVVAVKQVFKFVREKIEYVKDKGECWQYAYETAQLKQGDCEDCAILFAQLLIQSKTIPTENIFIVHADWHAFNVIKIHSILYVVDVINDIDLIELDDYYQRFRPNINFIFSRYEVWGQSKVFKIKLQDHDPSEEALNKDL